MSLAAPSARMPPGRWLRGKRHGRELDLSSRRPLRLLEPEFAAAYAPAEGELVAADFYHEGRFWVAKFPRDAVARVMFLKWDFGQWRVRLRLLGRTLVDADLFHVSHTELRFQLERPVELYSPGENGRATAPAFRVDDLVSSVEAVGVPGETFNLWGGLCDHFVAVRRFKSLRENFYERVVEQGRVIQQWEVALEAPQRNELLRRAILDSHEAGCGTLYHVFAHSCTTEAFRLIDSVVRYGIKRWRTVFRRIPHFPEAYLWARGLLKPRGESRLPTLNEEKAQWRQDPALLERRKAWLAATRAERGAARAERRARAKASK